MNVKTYGHLNVKLLLGSWHTFVNLMLTHNVKIFIIFYSNVKINFNV